MALCVLLEENEFFPLLATMITSVRPESSCLLIRVDSSVELAVALETFPDEFQTIKGLPLNFMQISRTFVERHKFKRVASSKLLLTEISETVRVFVLLLICLHLFDDFIWHGTCVVAEQTGRRSVPRDTQARHLALTQSV